MELLRCFWRLCGIAGGAADEGVVGGAGGMEKEGATGGLSGGPRIAAGRHGGGRRVIQWGEAESSERECLQPFCPNLDIVIGGVELGLMQ